MKKEKEVEVKKEQAVVVSESWGQDDQHISSRDIMISKISPQQGLSKFVVARKAQIGEYRDSVSGELMGSIDAPFTFIPFYCEKLWEVFKDVHGKLTYAYSEPITYANEGRPRSEVIDGVKHEYNWTYRYFVILPKDVEAGLPIPYIISFRRTSFKGGSKLFTQMYVRNKQSKLSPAAYAINLEGFMKSNDKGTFVVLDVSPARKTTTAEDFAAREMYNLVKSGSARIDESDIQEEGTQAIKAGVSDDIAF